MAHELSEHCIYTIVDGKALAAAAASGQAREFIEAKAWVTGQRLWQSAKQAGLGMPVLFGDAAKGGPLLHWGILTLVAIDGGRTRYSVDRLRRIAGQRYPQD